MNPMQRCCTGMCLDSSSDCGNCRPSGGTGRSPFRPLRRTPWQTTPGSAWYATVRARYRDSVLVFGGMDTIYLCKEGRLERHLVELAPGCTYAAPIRRQTFLNGVVYINDDNWGASKAPSHPLFYLGDFQEGARIITQFKDSAVRDLFVENGILYVLTSRFEDPGFAGEIYATRDLKHWTRRAHFSVPARPNSCALLDGAFYIGLANRGYDPKTYVEKGEHAYAFADKASGSIWRLQP